MKLIIEFPNVTLTRYAKEDLYEVLISKASSWIAKNVKEGN